MFNLKESIRKVKEYVKTSYVVSHPSKKVTFPKWPIMWLANRIKIDTKDIKVIHRLH